MSHTGLNMQIHFTKFGQIQLAAISACAFMLLCQPALAFLVAAVVGVSLAFSMASAMAVGHYYSSKNIEKLSRQHGSLLGTHFGGMLCYLVMISEAFKYIPQ
jgi:hypothetical protein